MNLEQQFSLPLATNVGHKFLFCFVGVVIRWLSTHYGTEPLLGRTDKYMYIFWTVSNGDSIKSNYFPKYVFHVALFLVLIVLFHFKHVITSLMEERAG